MAGPTDFTAAVALPYETELKIGNGSKSLETLLTNMLVRIAEAEAAAAAAVDVAVMEKVVDEDFLNVAGQTLPLPWLLQDTSSAGTPVTDYVDDEVNGRYELTSDSQAEAQALGLNFNDVLLLDPALGPILEAGVIWTPAGAAGTAETRFVVGLASARNATLDSIAEHAWFRVEGASMALLVEGDDGTTDTNDQATAVTVVKDSLLRLQIDMTDLSAVAFKAKVGSGAWVSCGTVDISDASGLMQPFIEYQKDSGATVNTLTVDYVKVLSDRA